jgi:co-chaperonin GroES (HSP10)
MRLQPAPGYLVLKKHSLKKKIGGFEMPNMQGEDAPELGEVLEVGPLITKMPFEATFLPKVHDIVAYKKFNVYTLKLGVKEYIATHFSNYLFTVKEDVETESN